MATVPTDPILVERAAAGDRDAFAQLVRRHGGALRFALTGRAGDPDLARDIVQDAWIRAARGLSGFDVGQRFRPWLFAIGFNALRDHYRTQGRRVDFDAAELCEEATCAPRDSHAMTAIDEREAIDSALDLVEEPYQSAIRLVDVLGLDYAEAAASLDCAAGTVKSRVSRGRQAFRLAYERLVGARGPQPVPHEHPGGGAQPLRPARARPNGIETS